MINTKLSAWCQTRTSDDKPIAYQRRMGPTASSVSPACCLGQGDTARLSCNQSLIFGELYHDKVQEHSHLTWAMHSALGASLLSTEGLVAG
jgi:hypothetical protein